MTYEQIVDAARRHAPTSPAFSTVWNACASRMPVGKARTRSAMTGWIILASVAVVTLLSIGQFALDAWSMVFEGVAGVATAVGAGLLLMLGMLGPVLLALVLRRSRSVVSQVLVRAAGWSMMEFFVVTTFLSGPGLREMGAPVCLVLVLFFGVALLLLRDKGLDELDPEFHPAAYRGRLLGTLVLAFADAQVLVMLTAIQVSFQFPTSMILLPAVAAVVMAVATWGLARLRGWGLILNLVANLVVAGLALAGYLTTALPFVVALTATAVIQVLLVLPLVRVVVGRQIKPRANITRPYRWPALAVVALMLTATAATVVVEAQGRALTSWSCPTLGTLPRLEHKPSTGPGIRAPECPTGQ